MSDSKCDRCGLVNWSGEIECKRCFKKLGRRPRIAETLTVEPAIEGSGFRGVWIGLVALAIVGAGIYGGYLYVLPEPKPAAALAAQKYLDEFGPTLPEKQRKMLELEAARRDGGDKVTWEEKLMEARKAAGSGEATFPVSTPQNDRFLYLPPGQMGPPGAAVPYTVVPR